jgi:crossover junction endodeoxyribonuclease RuvC
MRRRRPLGRDASLEARLWARLRALEGVRFRRKSPFRSFTLDFVEHDARLVVELVEGAPGRAPARSVVRDRLLSEAGYVILRLWRDEAARDPAAAIARIRAVLEDLSTP